LRGGAAAIRRRDAFTTWADRRISIGVSRVDESAVRNLAAFGDLDVRTSGLAVLGRPHDDVRKVGGGGHPELSAKRVISVSERLLVLAWHNVEGTWHYPIPAGTGVRGLARLKELATVVPLAPAMEALGVGRPLPPRAIALTFDDGYQDNLRLAAPLLEKLRLPATFFLVPGLLSGDVRAWWEILAWGFARSTRATVHWDGRVLPTRGRAGRASLRWTMEGLKCCDQAVRQRKVTTLLDLLEPEGEPNDRNLFLDWDGARELVRRGFSVGSHSLSHPIFSQESPDEQLRDLVTSRRQLEAELGVPMELLAYPNGTRADYNADTVHAAQQAGHTHAFGAHAGIVRPSTPPYAAPRMVMEPQRGFSRTLAQRVVAKLTPTRLPGIVLRTPSTSQAPAGRRLAVQHQERS
jgi:peptidoglycan/xylan/chitin deacetylase (PgdA/CDA1 family)